MEKAELAAEKEVSLQVCLSLIWFDFIYLSIYRFIDKNLEMWHNAMIYLLFKAYSIFM